MSTTIELAFGVMTYQKHGYSAQETWSEFKRLMTALYRSDRHVYILHVDSKSDHSLIRAVHEGYCASKQNCKYIQPRNVAWAGISTAEMMMALMQSADEVIDVQWEYFVLLGHESVLLTSVSYMEFFFANAYPRGTNFINCWDTSGYDYFGQWEDNTWRVEQVAVDTFAGSLLYDQDHEDRRRWQRSNPFDFRVFKSLQHVTLSRAFVRHALFGPETRRVMVYLANVQTCDEMVLPTLLHADPVFSATATCDTTLHYSHWVRPGYSASPEYLTLEHLPLLLQMIGTTALFSRKIHVHSSAELVWAIDKIRKEVFCEGDGDNGGECADFHRYSLPLISPIVFRSHSNYTAGAKGRVASGRTESPPAMQYITRHMSWLLPVARDYVSNVFHDYSTAAAVRSVISSSGVLDHGKSVSVEPGLQRRRRTEVDDAETETTNTQSDGGNSTDSVFSMLRVLDFMRRAREEEG